MDISDINLIKKDKKDLEAVHGEFLGEGVEVAEELLLRFEILGLADLI